MDGNIVVDEVLASCYAFSDHDVAHIVTLPLRWFPEIMDWIFAFDNESVAYANIWQDVGRFMLPSD